MKYAILLFCTAFSLFSCSNNQSAGSDQTSEEVPTDTGGSQDDPDLVAIDACIHGFYQWNETNMGTLANINYVKVGKPATLDIPKLTAYFTQLKESGFISQAYIDSETAYVKNLEATAWKAEDVGEGPLTGLDYDRFTCSQDYDLTFWKTAPVSAEGLGTDKAIATMAGMEGGSPREQKFELVKENGKWLIAKILCE